jgi:hypothetical protein
VAAVRKLLVICFGVLKTGKPFDPAIAMRLVLDGSGHAAMLKQIEEGDLALDGQHGVYRDSRSAVFKPSGESKASACPLPRSPTTAQAAVPMSATIGSVKSGNTLQSHNTRPGTRLK